MPNVFKKGLRCAQQRHIFFAVEFLLSSHFQICAISKFVFAEFLRLCLLLAHILLARLIRVRRTLTRFARGRRQKNTPRMRQGGSQRFLCSRMRLFHRCGDRFTVCSLLRKVQLHDEHVAASDGRPINLDEQRQIQRKHARGRTGFGEFGAGDTASSKVQVKAIR